MKLYASPEYLFIVVWICVTKLQNRRKLILLEEISEPQAHCHARTLILWFGFGSTPADGSALIFFHSLNFVLTGTGCYAGFISQPLVASRYELLG